jgi:hypothetical protein
MADKHSEPQILTTKTTTQISKKGVESGSYAATIEHLAAIPTGIDGGDDRLPSL